MMQQQTHTQTFQMHMCCVLCTILAIYVAPCTPCDWHFEVLRNWYIPGMVFVSNATGEQECQWACMRIDSCFAINVAHNNTCYWLYDKTRLLDRRESEDIDLHIMNIRCPIPTCKPNTCQNGGTCRVAVTGYTFLRCDCPTSYTGPMCQLYVAASTDKSRTVHLYLAIMALVLLILSIGAGIAYILCKRMMVSVEAMVVVEETKETGTPAKQVEDDDNLIANVDGDVVNETPAE